MYLKKPDWIKKQLFNHSQENQIKNLIKDHHLHTVCQEAKCPNRGECFSRQTATFLLLGNVCTRSCRFCNISRAEGLQPLDPREPLRTAEAVKQMNLKYVVLTSVTRDDLSDGGASVFLRTILEIKKIDPSILIEILVPDFKGDENIILELVQSGINVFNHNLETVPRLYSHIRPQANYGQSLKVLEWAKRNSKKTIIKSGIMVGLGETKEEVIDLLSDFKQINGDMMTIGQYLAPARQLYPVQRYVTPEEFLFYKNEGEKRIGLKKVISAPFVRSSYRAELNYLD